VKNFVWLFIIVIIIIFFFSTGGAREIEIADEPANLHAGDLKKTKIEVVRNIPSLAVLRRLAWVPAIVLLNALGAAIVHGSGGLKMNQIGCGCAAIQIPILSVKDQSGRLPSTGLTGTCRCSALLRGCRIN
jgi:hypothetical protein